MSQAYEQFFERATGFTPYRWQVHVAVNGFPHVLAVPTGMGKTEGAVLAWAWRLWQKKEPRHLVYSLPMRVLVTQTVQRLRCYFDKLDCGIAVYELMAGAIDEEWAAFPEKPWVLVGTQDQLLSRALNRGYAMSRFEWPVHFGLLNNDCRWIIDEVQLMGPGLWTTAQLDWMRSKRFGTIFDCPTTWMSATVGAGFGETTDRKRDGLVMPTSLPAEIIEADSNREMQARLRAKRPIEMWPPQGSAGQSSHRKKRANNSGNTIADFYGTLANEVQRQHVAGTLSLVICNTVEAARRIYERLQNKVPKVLLTSRFRRQDRDENERRVLDFEARRKATETRREQEGLTWDRGKPLPNDPGLICVSTQIVEAGVDISAHRLWSELAPWSVVIQRLGRLNRDGRDQEARAWFWASPDAPIAPYEPKDVKRTQQLINMLVQLSQEQPFYAAVHRLMSNASEDDLKAALQARPEPMPRALDVHGLFSTERDVHGGFTDVSAFVRGVDPDADLTVIWRDWESGVRKAPPHGDSLDGPPLDIVNEGCPVPFYRLGETLKNSKARAWLWNEENEEWEEIQPNDLRPGMVVMLHRDAGGYSRTLGWTGDPSDKIDDVPRAGRGHALHEDEPTEAGFWVPLNVHLRDAHREAEKLCDDLNIPNGVRSAVVEAARWHDLGKAHPQWQNTLPKVEVVGGGPWAKCPCLLVIDLVQSEAHGAITSQMSKVFPNALRLPEEQYRLDGKQVLRLRWVVERRLKQEELRALRRMDAVRWAGHVPFRPGLRHEAASALAMWRHYREGRACYPALAVYLAAAHHGKVRTVFRSFTDEGNDAFGVPPHPALLELDDNRWELDFTVAKDGAEGTWTPNGFVLTGHGWTGLMADLLGPWEGHGGNASHAGVVPEDEPRALGPFKLAYLEALVRIADWRASAQPSQCIKLSEVYRDK